MARQPYFVNTSQKQLELFESFGGGMVSQAHPEKLRDDQSTLIENADVVQGGILQGRGAYSQTNHAAVIHIKTMDDFKDEDITFDELKNYTFDQLKTTGITRDNMDTSNYFKTFSQLKLEKITFDTLKEYTFDELKNQGVLKPNTGDSQGMFRYYTETGFTDIVAIKGKLYTIVDDVTYKKLPIQGLQNFQTTKTVEAVQHRDKMYIATGSGIVIYDGVSATALEAYKPNGLEALYFGTNGYAVDPLNYLSDTTGSANLILGVTTSLRYGIVNTDITFTAYVQKIAADTLEYQFETQTGTEAYTVVQAWGLSKTLTAKFATAADYVIRVSVRKSGTTITLNQYSLPKYTINVTDSSKEEDSGVNFDNLAACNRLFIHYDRLFLYGDDENQDSLYISHLDKFDYFPRTNIIKVTDPMRGELQRVVRYKNMLLCWTNGSIQMISGTSPLDFSLQPVHTTLGTLHGKSVQIMKNHVVFVGNDNGLYILKSFNYSSDDKLNVERIDDDIRDSIDELIKDSTNVLSTITNNQYMLYIETDKQNYVYRFYYEYGIWVRDTIALSFKTLETLSNVVIACATNNGTVYKLTQNKFLDGTNKQYTMRVVSKDFNFKMPHHRKKLKQYQLIVNLTSISSLRVSTYVDNNLLSITPLGYDPLQNSDAQKLTIMASGRFRYVKTDITIPVKEHIQLVGFGYVFKQNTPK